MPGLSRTALERIRAVVGAELGSEGPPPDVAHGTFGEPLGDGIPRYSLYTELGRGGMGTVWLAFDRSLQRFVALKRLHGCRADQLERFLREARFLSRLRHPGIVVVHDLGAAGGAPYFTMEHVAGVSLARLDDIGVERACEICRDVAFAVHHAHEQGILHRDLKPSNILVRTDGSALVTDFGLARLIEDERHLTEPGKILGTALYMSPEQVSCGTLGPWTDVYGLGATLYELVTRSRLFDATDARELLRRIGRERPRPPRERVPGIPVDLERIILRAVEIDPRQRFGSMHEFAEALDRWLDTHREPAGRIPAAAPDSDRTPRPGARRRRLWIVAGAGAAGALAIVAANLAFHRSDDAPPEPIAGDSDAADPLVTARSRLREARGVTSPAERDLRRKLLEEARSLAGSSNNGVAERDPLLAEIAFERGEFEECLARIEEARRRDPRSHELAVLALRARLRLLLAGLDFYKFRDETSIAHLRDPEILAMPRSSGTDPQLDPVVQGLSILLESGFDLERVDEAEILLRRADSRLIPEARVVAGLFLYLSGEGTRALAEFRAGAAADPWFAPAWVLLGWASLDWGEDDAREHLDQVLAASGGHPSVPARRLLAATHFKEGRSEEARAELESLLPEGEDAHEIECDLGTIALASGDPSLALRRFEDCLRRMPDDYRPLYLQACALAQGGRPAEALTTLEASIRQARAAKSFVVQEEALEPYLLLTDLFGILSADRVREAPYFESVRRESTYRQRIEPLLRE